MGTNPPVEIAAWLGCLTFVVMLINHLMKVVDRVRGKPTPGEVQSDSIERFVAKSEFRDHVLRNDQEHDNFFKKLGGVERGLTRELQEMERRLNASDEARTSKLHDRLNNLDNAVAAVNERTLKK
jgi:hypothetical protein